MTELWCEKCRKILTISAHVEIGNEPIHETCGEKVVVNMSYSDMCEHARAFAKSIQDQKTNLFQVKGVVSNWVKSGHITVYGFDEIVSLVEKFLLS
jgi:hypothetical protein